MNEIRRPYTLQVRSLSNASTELLIARYKELYGVNDPLVRMTCVIPGSELRVQLMEGIMAIELERRDLELMWRKAGCLPVHPAINQDDRYLIRTILDFELPAERSEIPER